MPIRTVVGAAALSVLATTTSAQVYDCRLDPNSTASLMPLQVIIQMSGPSRATVSHGWQDGPLTHDVSVRSTNNRMDFSFGANADVRGSDVPIMFNGTLFPGRGQLVLAWQPGSGWEGNSRGNFSCGRR
jgi:hypothetical protein